MGSVKVVQQLLETSGAVRSTGTTGANADSSRSHSVMQVHRVPMHQMKPLVVPPNNLVFSGTLHFIHPKSPPGRTGEKGGGTMQ